MNTENIEGSSRAICSWIGTPGWENVKHHLSLKHNSAERLSSCPCCFSPSWQFPHPAGSKMSDLVPKGSIFRVMPYDHVAVKNRRTIMQIPKFSIVFASPPVSDVCLLCPSGHCISAPHKLPHEESQGKSPSYGLYSQHPSSPSRWFSSNQSRPFAGSHRLVRLVGTEHIFFKDFWRKMLKILLFRLSMDGKNHSAT